MACLAILDAIIQSGYLMRGITIISVISFELFKQHGKPKVWYYGNTAAKFMFPLLYILTWYLFYHIFVSHEDKFVYLIQQSR